MPPAARITDMHTCPQPIHVGGPTSSGDSSVIIGFQPAARVGDTLVCKAGTDTISQGEPSVVIGFQDSARLGDATSHGGKLVAGCPTVIIGSSAQAETLKTDKPFCEECERKRKELEAEAQRKKEKGA